MLQFTCTSLSCLQLMLGIGSITSQSGSAQSGQSLIYQVAATKTTYSCKINSYLASCTNLTLKESTINTSSNLPWLW